LIFLNHDFSNPASGVKVVRAYILLANTNEMHILDYYASSSDQSRFAHIAPFNVKMFQS